MATRRVRRGFARRAELRAEGEVRQAEYDKLTPLQKLNKQWEAGHNGTRQVDKLVKQVNRLSKEADADSE